MALGWGPARALCLGVGPVSGLCGQGAPTSMDLQWARALTRVAAWKEAALATAAPGASGREGARVGLAEVCSMERDRMGLVS